MKKFLAAVLVIAVFLTPFGVLAQTEDSTPSAAPQITSSVDKKEVENLKQKIESKVAELARKYKKAVAGKVVAIAKNSLTLETDSGVKYTIKINSDLTKFYSISGASKK